MALSAESTREQQHPQSKQHSQHSDLLSAVLCYKQRGFLEERPVPWSEPDQGEDKMSLEPEAREYSKQARDLTNRPRRQIEAVPTGRIRDHLGIKINNDSRE